MSSVDKMIVNSSRLAVQEQMEATYRLRMQLTISHFRASDSGRYVCQAKNSLGEAEEAIQTYGNHLICLLVSWLHHDVVSLDVVYISSFM